MSENTNIDTKEKKKVRVKKRVVGSAYGAYGAYSAYGSYASSDGNVQYQQNGDAMPNRTMADYLKILKERMAWLMVTFFVIVFSVGLYTWRITPTYESMVRIRILRDSSAAANITGEADKASLVQNTEDFNTQVKILESQEVVFNVLNRLTDEEKKALMAPYQDTFSLMPKLTEAEIVSKNRSIMPERNSLVVLVSYVHPSPAIAADMANFFAEEYINFTEKVKSAKLQEEQEALALKLEQQARKVKELDEKLVAYSEKHATGSLDKIEDIDNQELSELNSILISAKKALDQSNTNWEQLQTYKDMAQPLEDLYFISTLPQVASLVSDRTQQLIAISALSKRYKEKHPEMISANKRLEQTEKELEFALASAYQKIKASHDALVTNYSIALQAYNKKNLDIIAHRKLKVEYDSILRERRQAESMHANLITNFNQKNNEINLVRSSAQVIDRAAIPSRPSSPNYVLNIAIGIFGGIFAGVGMALIVALMDDRVKSAYDIEFSIGLPLLGVLPRIRSLNSTQKAQITASNANRYVTEAFRSLYSSVGVNPFAKNAKLFLSTSTTPSEGKSFVMTNLAYTAAMNGERVIIVDADLRLPSIAKNLGIKSELGIMACVEQGLPLEDVIIRDVFPNVDLLMCEKRAANPMQILNSQRFMDMIESLKDSYDKVFIDTPPVGVVSDVMSIFPLVDAVMYVVKYNSVKRGLIKTNVKRMLDANMPIMGVVMNMVPMGTSEYGSLYNKKYQTYYSG